MDSSELNSLVGDYLATINTTMAKKFKKETKSSPLPPGSPGLAEIVKRFRETVPVKRKLKNGDSNGPAKKAKKVSIQIL